MQAAANSLKDKISQDFAVVNDTILALADAKHSELVPIITKYLQDAGGKRLRPMLTLAFAQLTDQSANRDQVINLAASVELIHTATLLHDDVVDDGKLRRGMKTANSIWGNKTAILLGDYLFSQAFKLMVSTKNLSALELLSGTAATIAEAEVKQIESLGNTEISLDQYLQLIRNKTAILFAAACRCGAYDAPSNVQQAAYDYGMNLGMAYQIIDDTLDYFAKEDEFGKKVGGDLLEKKFTLPLFMLVRAESTSQNVIDDVFQKDIVEQADIDQIILLLKKHDIFATCKSFASDYIDQAIAALERIERSDVYDSLHNLVLELNDRMS